MILYLTSQQHTNLLDFLTEQTDALPIKKMTGNFMLKQFVIYDMRNFSHCTELVLDRDAFGDDDIHFAEAIEEFLTMYNARITVICEGLQESAPLCHDLLEAGVGNIVTAEEIGAIQNEIRQSLSGQGMTRYKPKERTKPQEKEKLYQFATEGVRITMVSSQSRIGTTTMALGLNYKSGFQTKNKAKWTSVAVKRVLSNPMNKGIMIQGKRKRINYKVRKVIEKPQEQWNIKHNAVVTPMPLLCYDNVQRLLEQDIRVAPGQENVYLFAGMVYCADCGRSMTRRKTNENIFYICTTYNRGDGCSRHSIPNEKLKEVVLQTIRQYIETLMETDEILTYLDTLDIKESEIILYDEEIQSKYKELERYARLLTSLCVDRQDGVVSDAEFVEFKGVYEEKSIELEKNIAELKKRIQKMLDGRGAKREWIEQFKEYRNVNELDRIMLVLLVEKVLVYEKNRVEIIFRFKDEFETTMNYIRTMERCGRLTPSKEADERVVV